MKAISVDYQLQGLGRCWSTCVDHNNIYLECPTTKSLHVYRCKSGFINMVIGHQSNGIPIPVAKRTVDKSGRTTVTFSTTDEVASSFTGLGKAQKDGWSNELALKSIPNVCSKFVSMLFAKKDKDDFYKLLAETKVKRSIVVKYLKATDAYEFYLDGEEVDLEHILNVLIEVEVAIHGLTYTWPEDNYNDVIDDFVYYVNETFGA